MDSIVSVLILFPIILGGFWIKSPKLKIELVELGIPTVITALIFFVFWLIAKITIEDLKTFQIFKRIVHNWSLSLSRHRTSTLCLGFLLFATLWSFAALRRHWSYGSGAADLGIFTSAIYNLSHGYGYISSLKDGINLFADHQSPIFWVMAPAFKLFPYAETLLIIQSFALASGGIALFKVGTQYLDADHKLLPLLPFFYWFYLPVRSANSFDFHPEVLLLPCFLFAIYFLQSPGLSKKLIGGLFMILGIMGKESAGPVAVGICVSWLLGAAPVASQRFTRVLAVVLIPLALGVFIFETTYIPEFFGKTYAYSEHYQKYGEGLGGILSAPFLKPELFWPKIFGVTRLKFLFWTLAPLAFIPLLGFRGLVAALPGYLMLFLSEGDHRVNPIYHYAAEPCVGVFWAFCIGASRIKIQKYWTFCWILFFFLVSFGRSEIYKIRFYTPSPHHSWLTNELLPCINHEAAVSVSGAITAHLAARHWAHHLPRLAVNSMAFPSKKLVDCVVIDPSVNNWPLTTQEERPLVDELLQKNFKMGFSCGNTAVYYHDESQCLRCTPNCSIIK